MVAFAAGGLAVPARLLPPGADSAWPVPAPRGTLAAGSTGAGNREPRFASDWFVSVSDLPSATR